MGKIAQFILKAEKYKVFTVNQTCTFVKIMKAKKAVN